MLETLRLRIADARGRGPYSDRQTRLGCLFVHVPKTAGTSIVRALFETPSQHIPAGEYRRANPRRFKRLFKFAFVRNPWDRLVSSYVYLSRGGQHEHDRRWAEQHLGAYPDFDSFVRGWLTPENIRTGVHFQPQIDFLADRSGRVLMDFVGRFERLTPDFYHVAERLGRSVLLPQINRTPHEHYSRYYTPETMEIVARVYAADLETFGYAYE